MLDRVLLRMSLISVKNSSYKDKKHKKAEVGCSICVGTASDSRPLAGFM